MILLIGCNGRASGNENGDIETVQGDSIASSGLQNEDETSAIVELAHEVAHEVAHEILSIAHYIELLYAFEIRQNLSDGSWAFFAEDTPEFQKGLWFFIENDVCCESEFGHCHIDRQLILNPPYGYPIEFTRMNSALRGYIAHLFGRLDGYDILLLSESEIPYMRRMLFVSLLIGGDVYSSTLPLEGYLLFRLLPNIDARHPMVVEVFDAVEYITMPRHDNLLTQVVSRAMIATSSEFIHEVTFVDDYGNEVSGALQVPFRTYIVYAGRKFTNECYNIQTIEGTDELLDVAIKLQNTIAFEIGNVMGNSGERTRSPFDLFDEDALNIIIETISEHVFQVREIHDESFQSQIRRFVEEVLQLWRTHITEDGNILGGLYFEDDESIIHEEIYESDSAWLILYSNATRIGNNSSWFTLVDTPESHEHIEGVFEPLFDKFVKIFGYEIMTHRPAVIMNIPSGGGPMMTPLDTGALLTLNQTRTSFWAQTIFQMAHEMTHYVFFSHCPNLNNETFDIQAVPLWNEEIICSAISLFMLDYMANNWNKSALYNINPNFGEAVAEYLADILNSAEGLPLKSEGDYVAFEDFHEHFNMIAIENRNAFESEKIYLFNLFREIEPEVIGELANMYNYFNREFGYIDFNLWALEAENPEFIEAVSLIQPRLR